MQSAVAAQNSFFSTRKTRIALIIFAVILPMCASAPGQTGFTRIYGAEDQSVPMPNFVGALGQRDAGALQELASYRKAVNISVWHGMQASGMMTDSHGNKDHATLTIQGADDFRLDIQTPNGKRSTRISEGNGETLEANGKRIAISPAMAAGGLLAFPQLLASTSPSSHASLIDRGQVRIGGQTLHRITLEELAFPYATKPDTYNVNVTDLYFDPSTHLLLQSASAVQLDPADREKYLIVITYGGYQNVQGSLIPCRYSQSLNGQRQWSLQLNPPSLQPSVDASYFHF